VAVVTRSREEAGAGDGQGGGKMSMLYNSLAVAAEEKGIVLRSVIDAGKPFNTPELVAALSTPPSKRNAEDVLMLAQAAPRSMRHLASMAVAATVAGAGERDGGGAAFDNLDSLIASVAKLLLVNHVTYSRFDPGANVFDDSGGGTSGKCGGRDSGSDDNSNLRHDGSGGCSSGSGGGRDGDTTYMVLAGRARGVSSCGIETSYGPGDAFARLSAGGDTGGDGAAGATMCTAGDENENGGGGGDKDGDGAILLECALIDTAAFARCMSSATVVAAALASDDPTGAAALASMCKHRKVRDGDDERALAAAFSGSRFPRFRAFTFSASALQNGEAIEYDMNAAAERMQFLVLEPGRIVYTLGDVTTDTSGAFFVLAGSVAVTQGSIGTGGDDDTLLTAGDVFGLDALAARGAMEDGQRSETVTVSAAVSATTATTRPAGSGAAILAVLPWREHQRASKAASRRLLIQRVSRLRSLPHLVGASEAGLNPKP